MAYPAACQRLRVGGTVSGSTITGGTLIETYGINFSTWEGMLSIPGRSSTNPVNPNRDGVIPRVGGADRPGKLWRERFMTFQMTAFNRDAAGLITLIDGKDAELEANMDSIAELLLASDDLVVLERDMADGTTRFIEVEFGGASTPITRGPIFGASHASYGMAIPMVAPYPFWQSETEFAQAVPGTLSNTGTAPINNPIITFSAAGSLTHDEHSATLTALDACVVDLRRSQAVITQGGSRADNLIRRNKPWWVRFPLGDSTLSGSNVSLTYRLQYLI